mmetsp:Transcript_63524/g.186411  ORF Transcript_63524/g.186411 Transcript_63524/m.186411 type:complete len:163 (-) Transcript_63524:251-739(-)
MANSRVSGFLLLGAAVLLLGRLPSFALPATQGQLAGASLRASSGRRVPAVFRRGVEEEFEQGVGAARAVLFVQESHQASDMAKEVVTEMGVRFNEMELKTAMGLDSIGPASDYLVYMSSKTGSTDLPQIHFKGGAAIAGIDNIFDAQDSGELLEMFKKAGAA